MFCVLTHFYRIEGWCRPSEGFPRRHDSAKSFAIKSFKRNSFRKVWSAWLKAFPERRIHVRCTILACGQSVHYGRCSLSPSRSSRTQYLSTISHYDFFFACLEMLFFFQLGPYSSSERVSEREQSPEEETGEFKVRLESGERKASRTSHRPITPPLIPRFTWF